MKVCCLISCSRSCSFRSSILVLNVLRAFTFLRFENASSALSSENATSETRLIRY